MRAAWDERKGPARDVLVVGEMPQPAPGPGVVRVRLAFSGINPGDIKKPGGWLGAPMPYPRVIPDDLPAAAEMQATPDITS